MLKEAKDCLIKSLNENGYQVPGDIGATIECPDTFSCKVALIFHRHIIEGTKSLGPTSTLVREEGVQLVANNLNAKNECPWGVSVS